MIDPADIPDVSPDELLARYILYRNRVRADGSIKHEAFMPPSDLGLSVTRHLHATTEEIWKVGQDFADIQNRGLHGRGDLSAEICQLQGLSVSPDAVPGNPNHANIKGWPADKAAQMIIAKEIAAASAFIKAP